MFSPIVTQGIPTMCYPRSVPGPPLLLPMSTTALLGLLQQMAKTSENSEFQLPSLQKPVRVNFPLLTINGLGGVPPMHKTTVLLSLPFSPSHLHTKSTHPFATPQLFSPQFPSSHHIPTIFFPSNYEIVLNPQMIS